MRLGLIAAMEDETKFLLDKFSLMQWGDFYTGRIGDLELSVLVSGIGKVNAAIAAQKTIDNNHPDLVYFSGIAGAISTEVTRGDVVVASFLIQHDFDLTAFGYDRGVIPDTDCKVDGNYTLMLEQSCRKAGFEPHVGGILSGDIFMDKKKSKKRLGSHYAALCCDMESAAAAVACTSSNVPFACSKVISDSIDDTVENYNTNEGELALLSSRVSSAFVEFLSSNSGKKGRR